MFMGFPDYNLNGLAFNNGSPDTNGTYWNLDGPVNGWDSPDGRVTMLTKIGTGPQADGEYPADEHYRGRTITFKLVASSPSEAAREASRYLLAQALDLVANTGTFIVNEETPKQVSISRSGNNSQGKLTMTERGFSSGVAPSTPGFPTATPDSDNLQYLMEADIEVYCQDPRKYAVTPTTGSFVSLPGSAWGFAVSNPGNTTSPNLELNINSPAAGTITAYNALAGVVGQLVFAVPTTPGPALGGFPPLLTIDAYNQIITGTFLGNYYYLRDLRYGPWLAIPAGTGGQVVLSGGMAGLSGTWAYYPAWI